MNKRQFKISATISDFPLFIGNDKIFKKIKHVKEVLGEIKHSRLNNKTIINEFNWTPLYSIYTGDI